MPPVVPQVAVRVATAAAKVMGACTRCNALAARPVHNNMHVENFSAKQEGKERALPALADFFRQREKQKVYSVNLAAGAGGAGS